MPATTRRLVKSPQYRTLEQELRRLKLTMLPRRWDPTGNYPDRVFARTHGYRVLAHAEFEYYFEERAKELCRWAILQWKASQRPTRISASLLSYYGKSIGDLRVNASVMNPTERARWIKANEFVQRLDDASGRFHADIRNNHGIRESNIVQMLIPIGLEIADFDPVWLVNIDSFGQARGAAAHQSWSVHRLTTLPDPFDEYSTVRQLLLGVKDLDDKLNALMK